MPAKEARHDSAVVFRGTIKSFRDSGVGYRIAIFQVDRVWKGRLTWEFEMPALEGDLCIAFLPRQLEIRNELILYASPLSGKDGINYFPMQCNTALVRNARSVRDLGPGRRPR